MVHFDRKLLAFSGSREGNSLNVNDFLLEITWESLVVDIFWNATEKYIEQKAPFVYRNLATLK